MLWKIQGFVPHWEQFLHLCEDQPIPATLLMKTYMLEVNQASPLDFRHPTLQQLRDLFQDQQPLEDQDIFQAFQYLEKKELLRLSAFFSLERIGYLMDLPLVNMPLRAYYQAQQLKQAFSISHPHAKGLFPHVYREESVHISNHRSRARKIGSPATLTTEQWIETLVQFDLYCAYCRKLPYMAVEHFIPLTRGGGTTWDNCVPACCICNDSKGSLYPGQFQENVGQEILDPIVEYLYSRKERVRQTA